MRPPSLGTTLPSQTNHQQSQTKPPKLLSPGVMPLKSKRAAAYSMHSQDMTTEHPSAPIPRLMETNAEEVRTESSPPASEAHRSGPNAFAAP